MQVNDNLEQIRTRIAAAAARAGRSADEVTLVAVSKKIEPDRIVTALDAGQMIFGESKVQEAKAKIPLLPGRARWHMVGHLQSNKAREAVELFELIHSVDSVKLAGELSKWAERAGKTQSILIEVNVAGEASKFGVKPDAVAAMLEEINRLPRLEVAGLMTIAPYSDDAGKARP